MAGREWCTLARIWSFAVALPLCLFTKHYMHVQMTNVNGNRRAQVSANTHHCYTVATFSIQSGNVDCRGQTADQICAWIGSFVRCNCMRACFRDCIHVEIVRLLSAKTATIQARNHHRYNRAQHSWCYTYTPHRAHVLSITIGSILWRRYRRRCRREKEARHKVVQLSRKGLQGKPNTWDRYATMYDMYVYMMYECLTVYLYVYVCLYVWIYELCMYVSWQVGRWVRLHVCTGFSSYWWHIRSYLSMTCLRAVSPISFLSLASRLTTTLIALANSRAVGSHR